MLWVVLGLLLILFGSLAYLVVQLCRFGLP